MKKQYIDFTWESTDGSKYYVEFEVHLTYEEYGADADGNRSEMRWIINDWTFLGSDPMLLPYDNVELLETSDLREILEEEIDFSVLT